MFCVQCEQTIRTPAGNGCAYAQGMCGKTAETSDLQDVLIYTLQGLSAWALAAREHDIVDDEIDALQATLKKLADSWEDFLRLED